MAAPPPPAPGRPGTTVATLFEEFLAFSRARGRSPTTLHGYRMVINGFWLPEIGDLELHEVTAHALDTLYARLLTRPRPLAPATVRKYHAILSAALAQAVKWEWIDRNPARMATLPPSQHPDPVAPTSEEVSALIDACARHSEVLSMFVLVGAVTGCRRGELAALTWGDYADGALHVRGSAYRAGADTGVKTTKTGRQRRILVGALERTLSAWRARCEATARDAGAELGPGSYLFSNVADASVPLNVNTVSAQFRRAASSLGLESIHLHSLRHFAATQLISSGVDPRTAATRLGHANPSMTLRVYAHATGESERRAAEVGARVLLDHP
jgi:integrase